MKGLLGEKVRGSARVWESKKDNFICSRALYYYQCHIIIVNKKPTIFVKTSRGRILFRNTYDVGGRSDMEEVNGKG